LQQPLPRATSTLRVCGVVALLLFALVAATVPQPTRAAGTPKQLQRVRGTIGYQSDAAGTDFKAVFGKFDLPDPDYAATHAGSAAVLAMPDSSLISLGQNTVVQVGAFDDTAASPGSTITINGGAMRFEIKRPQGGAANYHFVTPTSQTAVRGTVGLISFVNGVTTVGCVACAADSITVTTATQTLTLVTGQFVTVSALGAVTTGALSTVVGGFSAAGVPVTAQTGAIAAGLPAGAGAAGAATTTGIVTGAALAGAAAGVAASSHATPQPAATNAPTNTPAPAVTPTQSGSVNLTAHLRPSPAPLTTPGLPGRPSR